MVFLLILYLFLCKMFELQYKYTGIFSSRELLKTPRGLCWMKPMKTSVFGMEETKKMQVTRCCDIIRKRESSYCVALKKSVFTTSLKALSVILILTDVWEEGPSSLRSPAHSLRSGNCIPMYEGFSGMIGREKRRSAVKQRLKSIAACAHLYHSRHLIVFTD